MMRCAAFAIMICIAAIASSEGECPAPAGTFDPYGGPAALTIAGDYVYSTTGYVIMTTDISAPGSPQIVGQRYIEGSGECHGIAAAGDYVYIADQYIGLLIFDVSNRELPLQVGTFDLLGAYGITIVGSRAYVAAYANGLKIIDISEPVAPIEIGAIETPGLAINVAIVGELAYVADYYSVRVIDVGHPTLPVEIGYREMSKGVMDLAIEGKYAFVANGESGLRILNVENSFSLEEVGSCPTVDWAWGLAYSKGLVLVADWWGGLRVIRINDPAAPIEVGAYVMSDTYDVGVSGNFAYARWWAFDLSSCYQPHHVRPLTSPH
jgi:hypothetical protein